MGVLVIVGIKWKNSCQEKKIILGFLYYMIYMILINNIPHLDKFPNDPSRERQSKPWFHKSVF